MTSKVIAVIAFAIALRGSYLGKKATTDDEKIDALLHSAGAIILSMVALLLM